jgi:hypothetical protein
MDYAVASTSTLIASLLLEEYSHAELLKKLSSAELMAAAGIMGKRVFGLRLGCPCTPKTKGG